MRSNRLAVAASLAVAGFLLRAPAAGAEGLPWGRSLAAGRDLPRPFGIGLTAYDQTQPYRIDSLSFSLPGFSGVDASLIGVDSRIDEVGAQFDAWLLPFLDVVVMVGSIDGRTRVSFRELGLPLPFDGITVDYDGIVYGGGVTLAGGGERWFCSLSALFTTSDLSGDFDSSIDAFVVMPRVGLGTHRVSAWLGAMYQQTDESHAGTIVLPFLGPAEFSVELSQKAQWNGLVGLNAELGEHWTLAFEGGFGSRQSSSATLAWRF